MMRVLRSSLYSGMGASPITTVVRERDVTDTLESVAIRSHQPGALVVHDIFITRNGDIQAATHEAMARMRPDRQREQNMAVLFFWALMQFGRLVEGGRLLMNKPAPLTVEDVQYVFDQLKRQPGYRNFHITSFASDGTMVEVVEGEVR